MLVLMAYEHQENGDIQWIGGIDGRQLFTEDLRRTCRQISLGARQLDSVTVADLTLMSEQAKPSTQAWYWLCKLATIDAVVGVASMIEGRLGVAAVDDFWALHDRMYP